MKGYVLDYVNENEFKKLELALKKYNMLAYKKLNFEYYPELRKGNLLGELVSVNKSKGTEKYELKLPSDKMFAKIYSEVKLVYTVYKNEHKILLETINPSDILLEGHRSQLETYKGVMISKENAEKDKFKIDLLAKMQNKTMMFIAVLSLLLLVVGATYAYFVAQGGDSASKNVTVTTDTTDSLTFSIGRELKITADQTSFAQGQGNAVDTTVATAKLIAGTNRTPSYDYYMYLDISKNEFSYTTLEKTAELILTVLDPDDNPVTTIDGLDYVTVNGVSGFDITEKTGVIEILNHTITTSGTKVEDWDVTLTFVNLDSDQNSNTGKQFAAELKLQKDKIQYHTYCNETQFACKIAKMIDTDATLYYHDSNLVNSAEDNSYRYSGSSETTNNFVCFGSDEETCPNDDLYRIIGVFGDQVKLIKADYATTDQLGTDGDYKEPYGHDTSYYKGQVEASKIGGYMYNYNGLPDKTINNGWGLNDWETSLLNKTNLNTNYINYLNSQNPKWVKMIADTKWNIGGKTSEYVIAKKLYDAEKALQTSEASKIGLMSVSDYGYATLPSNWSKTLADYNTTTIEKNNWMYMGLYEWTITPVSSNSSFAFYVYSSGSLLSTLAHIGYVGRPVLYLKADVSYVSGEGTSSKPFRIN